MNWEKITSDKIVKNLLIDRATIEQEIRRLDSNALINYDLEALTLPDVMPSLICHYNEKEGAYLTVGKTYQAIGENDDGFEIIDDSGYRNTYSTAYLNEA